jgi:hypothetical protein
MKPTLGYGQPMQRSRLSGSSSEYLGGGLLSTELVFSSVIKSLFMIQLLSRKNKKGAVFFEKDSASSFFHLYCRMVL